MFRCSSPSDTIAGATPDPDFNRRIDWRGSGRRHGQRYFLFLPLSVFLWSLFSGCQDIEKPDPLPWLLASGMEAALNGEGKNRIGIVTGQPGENGRFLTMDPGGNLQPGYRTIYQDATAVYQRGKVYILNRLGRDNVQVLNPATGFATESEFSTGTGSNPWSIALSSDTKAYVSLYERDFLLIQNPRTGEELGRIPLRDYADGDGLPETAGLLFYKSRLFVALQRLDRNSLTGIFPPTDHSTLLEIDTTTDRIVASWSFPTSNPFTALRMKNLSGTDTLISVNPAGVGVNSDRKGCVVGFRIQEREFLPDCLYRETEAEGDLLEAVLGSESVGYALVLLADSSMEIQRFNPSTGKKVSVLARESSSGGFLSGLLLGPDGTLYAAESSRNEPGIALYDTLHDDRRINAGVVPTGLRPLQLIYIE